MISGDSVVVTWNEPEDQGSAITEYKVYIRQADGVTYALDLPSCDGRIATVINTRSCLVPIKTLRAAPFSLPWGSSVFVKIEALNAYGISSTSLEGNGAVILTKPDSPMGLTEVVASKTATSITLIWEEG